MAEAVKKKTHKRPALATATRGREQKRPRTEESDSTTDAPWDRLPPELQTAVLVRLPLQERVKARRVCRPWAVLLEPAVCWSDVRRLTLRKASLGIAGDKQEHSWDKDQLLDERRRGPALVRRFCGALRFLLPRSAPLTSLELTWMGELRKGTHERLLEMAAGVELHLRHLAFLCRYFNDGEMDGVRRSLAKLIRRQAGLETLVIGEVPGDRSLHHLVPLEAMTQLQHLRILVLHSERLDQLAGLSAPLLSRLHSLVVYSAYRHCEGGDVKRDKEIVCQHLAKTGLVFQQQDVKTSFYYCYYRLLWARVGLEVDKAMADKAMYSINFLRFKKWPFRY